jgi:hypothetical protein
MIDLDASTLDEIARLLCGDDGPLYRKGWELRDFMQRAGLADVPDQDGAPRRPWTRQALEGGDSQAMNAERAILRLADAREYAGEKAAYQETLRQLSDILSLEGLQVVHDRRGRPRLAELDEPRESKEALLRVELKVSISQVITDHAMAAVAEQRLREAKTCQEAGAYVATLIMLGSLLEGVLIAVVEERLPGDPPKPLDRIGLEELINLAHKSGWIQVDAKLGSELIRRYRNLVHPAAQLRIGDPPDADTLDMCWPVVNATLNDLAESARRSATRRPHPTGIPQVGASSASAHKKPTDKSA